MPFFLRGTSVPLLTLLLTCCAAPFGLIAQNPSETEPTFEMQVPDPDPGADSLAARAKAQMESAGEFKVFHGFKFTDIIAESGISFRHRAVNDALQSYKMAHYDHGSAVAVADVNGDGLYDVLFINQLGGNELWRNLGGGRFENLTAVSGLALPKLVSVGASFADVDNDGDPDVLITTVRGGAHLFENDGHGRFRDVTKASGIYTKGHAAGAMFFDYDRDGLVDLLICNVGNFTTDEIGSDGVYVAREDALSGHLFPDRYERSVLYKNLGSNKFKEVTVETGLVASTWSGDASFSDLNGDGWPDVYLMNMQGDDHYFENQEGKRFVDKTSQYFPKTPWGSMGIQFFDYDNDGRMDLLLTDMHSDMSEEIGPERERLKSEIKFAPSYLATKGTSIFGNALFHNLGDGKFEEVSDRMGVENYWPWGVSVADINADGWDDIFVTAGMGYPYRYGINSMLLNNGGEEFLPSEFLLGIEPRRDGRTHALAFSVDCWAKENLALKVCQQLDGKNDIIGALSSRSSVIFDLDGDGDLDIVTNEFNSVPMVLVSDLAQKKNARWLKIVLRGTESNRNGLGALVRVHVNNNTYVKPMSGKSGYLGQSVLPLYFGLGDSTEVDQIEVEWPSGQTQTFQGPIELHRTMTITEATISAKRDAGQGTVSGL